MPKDPAKKAKGRILVDYGMAHFDSAYQKLRTELMKEAKEQSQPVIDGAKGELKKLLQRFEDELGDQQYLARRFFFGRCRLDSALYPAGRFWRAAGSVAATPGKILERVKARPSVKALL